MAITPLAGYKVDPTNSNGVVPVGQPTPSTSITSANLAPTTPITVPPASPIDTGSSANASIPNPVPTIQDITDQSNKPTDAQGTQSTLLDQIAKITGKQQSLATLQTQQENQAGVPALTKTMNDLGTQLQGLNDQATLLQNYAMPGGLIQNQVQEKAQGTNATGGGLAPIQADQLRANQIKQATIATQALTVKSAYYAAQGNYSMAKDAADKAAQVAFDASEQEIKGKQAQLAAIEPTLTREEKIRAATLSAQLADRTQQIQNQREDFKVGQPLIAATLKFFANNPSAQYAAQQAMKLDPKDPQYLQKVMGLVGQYQQDPVEVQKAVDQHLAAQQNILVAQANIRQSDASAAKSRADIRKINAELAPSSVGATDAMLAKQPTYNKLTAKQKTQADAANNIVSALQTYRDNYSKLVRASGSNIAGTDSALLESSYNALIFQVAQAVGTGALQQADREVIEKIIPNPTTFSGSFDRILKGGKQGGLDKIDSQITQFTKQLTNYGIEPTNLNSLESQVAAKGYDYAAMKKDGLTDEQIKAAIQ